MLGVRVLENGSVLSADVRCVCCVCVRARGTGYDHVFTVPSTVSKRQSAITVPTSHVMGHWEARTRFARVRARVHAHSKRAHTHRHKALCLCSMPITLDMHITNIHTYFSHAFMLCGHGEVSPYPVSLVDSTSVNVET
jgi:hypothetical protein